MTKTLVTQITDCIEKTFNINGIDYSNRIIVFPCGDVGIQVFNILSSIYEIEPAYLIDNTKCKYSPKICEFSHLEQIDTEEYVLFLASTNPYIYDELKESVEKIFSENKIVELECMLKDSKYPDWRTEIGRYSYGPICCDHPWIKSIGAFCSFAVGVDFVTNHEFRYITTHPIIYSGKNFEEYEYSFEIECDQEYYLDGIEPKKEYVKKQRRAMIGNDVWLGRNVIVTNSANIGNGVIAAAGAVITKDVPDYAIVAGVPARIIRYRYTQEQIDALNKIAWWDWSDDEIRERFDDFYLPIEDFIKKYKSKI